MHADAAMGAGMVFDPSGMKSVVGFEFAPVGHWSAFERPAGGFFAQHGLLDVAAVVRVAVRVGAFLFHLVEDAEVAFGSGFGSSADGDRHGEKTIGAFHHISALFAERNLHADIVWIFRKFRRAVVGVVGGEAAAARAGAGWHERCSDKGGSKAVEVFSVHGLDGFVTRLSFDR